MFCRKILVYSLVLVLCAFPSTCLAFKKLVPTYRSHLYQFQKVAREVGIEVKALPSGNTIFRYHSDIPLIPASLTKLLTSYTALKRLGPFYHFKTRIYAMQEPKDGTIDGNIWVKSDGDCFLVAERVWDLARKLKALGVRRITGGVYVDDSFFDPETTKMCVDGKCSEPYNPVISPTAIDFNTITFNVFPGPKVGSPGRVEWFPPGDYVDLDNELTTGARHSHSHIIIESLGMTATGREQFRIRGKLPIHSDRLYEYRFNIEDPVSFFAHSFRGLLQEVGIQVQGRAAGDRVPAGAKLLLTYESPPLGAVLYGLNRYSNNFMAEMLARTFGAQILGSPGTVDKGIQVIYETLAKLGIPASQVHLTCGSGLSRHCEVSPHVFCTVLADAYHDFSLAPEYMASMAMNGQDGTLQQRMHDPSILVRGKTGTLRNVSCFAGYVRGPRHKVYAVAIMLNQVRRVWDAEHTIDSFVEDLPTFAAKR